MRVACILINHLPIQVEKTLCPSTADRPLIIVRGWDDRVVDMSPDLADSGVHVGDTRRRAEQLSGPQAVVLPAQETLYQDIHSTIKAELKNFADAVETGGLGLFFFDVGSLSQTFSSEEHLGLHITSSINQTSQLLVAGGIAGNKFTALQAAGVSKAYPGSVRVVPPGKEKLFLAEFPLTVLPEIPLEMLRRLHLFGITTLGGLAQLPRPAVTLQFGAEAAFFLDLARGIDARPIAPQAPPPIVQHTRPLEETLTDRHRLVAVLDQIVKRIATDLAQLNCHTTAMALTITDEAGASQSAGATIKPPSGDVVILQRTVARLFGKLNPLHPVGAVCVTAYPLREWHAGARQLSLFSPAKPHKRSVLRHAIRVLKQRFGEAVIQIASALGPPLPLPIHVHTDSRLTPSMLEWGGWARRVVRVCETWIEQRRWWDNPIRRKYYQLETQDRIIFTVFQDDHGRWFLERRYTI